MKLRREHHGRISIPKYSKIMLRWAHDFGSKSYSKFQDVTCSGAEFPNSK
jgi:hypothetical protein